ncbi:hypothetical protein A5675_08165 [Mycobacterium malmoense]|nr:hypothetical protein A5675_08165 [Mycobacterium malmoense]
MFGAARTQKEGLDLTGVLVADRQNHAGFGDSVVGRILADDGIDQQVMDPLNPQPPCAADGVAVFVGVGVARLPQGGQFALESPVGLR